VKAQSVLPAEICTAKRKRKGVLIYYCVLSSLVYNNVLTQECSLLFFSSS